MRFDPHVVPRPAVDVAFLLPVERYVLAVSATSCLLGRRGVRRRPRPGGAGASAPSWTFSTPRWPRRPCRRPQRQAEARRLRHRGEPAHLRPVPGTVALRAPGPYWAYRGPGARDRAGGRFPMQTVVFLPLLVLAWSPSAARGGPTPGGRPFLAVEHAVVVPCPVTLAAVGPEAAQIGTALTTERASAPGAPTAQDAAARAGSCRRSVDSNPLMLVPLGAAVAAMGGPSWLCLPLDPRGCGARRGDRALLRPPPPRWSSRWRRPRAAGGWDRSAGRSAPRPTARGPGPTRRPRRRHTVPVRGGCRPPALRVRGRRGRGARRPPCRGARRLPCRGAGLLPCRGCPSIRRAVVLVDRRAAVPVDRRAAVPVDRRVRRGRDRAEDVSGRRRRRTGGPTAAVLVTVGWSVVALLVASWVGNVPGVAQRASGPTWQPQFVAAERACARRPSGTVRIRALPWSAEVPCSLVLQDR